MTEHPTTPPPELVQQWATQSPIQANDENWYYEYHVATQAARWGADQELQACCNWLSDHGYIIADPKLRAARRPKPLSLKEQALDALAAADGADHPVVATVLTADQHAIIRRALEALDD